MKSSRRDQARPLDIKTIDELAQRLGYSAAELQRIANSKRRYYRHKENRDSNGKLREFYPPIGPLAKVLELIGKRLLDTIELPECIHGYRKGRWYGTNAKMHVGKNLVCKLDIKDFFPSIHHGRVLTTFIHLGCSEEVAKFLTWLVTCDNLLPHGFHTSNVLSNIVISNLARRLQGICDKYNLTLTMYSDDISISGNIEENKFRKLLNKKLLPLIREFVEREGFHLNPDKTTILDKKDRQEVTGITVNRKPNIPKRKRRELLSTIKQYQLDGIPTNPDFNLLKAKQKLRGKIAWAQSVNPSFGQLLLIEFQKIDWYRLSVNSSN